MALVFDDDKKRTSIQISPGNPGARITGTHQVNILENDGHRVDGSVSASKTFFPSGPITLGSDVSYTHPTGSGVNVGIEHTPKHGTTDLSASASANLWQKNDARLDAVAGYHRHYDKVSGAGKPNYSAGIKFTHKF